MPACVFAVIRREIFWGTLKICFVACVEEGYFRRTVSLILTTRSESEILKRKISHYYIYFNRLKYAFFKCATDTSIKTKIKLSEVQKC